MSRTAARTSHGTTGSPVTADPSDWMTAGRWVNCRSTNASSATTSRSRPAMTGSVPTPPWAASPQSAATGSPRSTRAPSRASSLSSGPPRSAVIRAGRSAGSRRARSARRSAVTSVSCQSSSTARCRTARRCGAITLSESGDVRPSPSRSASADGRPPMASSVSSAAVGSVARCASTASSAGVYRSARSASRKGRGAEVAASARVMASPTGSSPASPVPCPASATRRASLRGQLGSSAGASVSSLSMS